MEFYLWCRNFKIPHAIVAATFARQNFKILRARICFDEAWQNAMGGDFDQAIYNFCAT